jgi:hypothetical protein
MPKLDERKLAAYVAGLFVGHDSDSELYWVDVDRYGIHYANHTWDDDCRRYVVDRIRTLWERYSAPREGVRQDHQHTLAMRAKLLKDFSEEVPIEQK